MCYFNLCAIMIFIMLSLIMCNINIQVHVKVLSFGGEN